MLWDLKCQINLNSNIEIHKWLLRETEERAKADLNSNIEIHKLMQLVLNTLSFPYLNSNIEIHKWKSTGIRNTY